MLPTLVVITEQDSGHTVRYFNDHPYPIIAVMHTAMKYQILRSLTFSIGNLISFSALVSCAGGASRRRSTTL